jgi:hypothetical protein
LEVSTSKFRTGQSTVLATFVGRPIERVASVQDTETRVLHRCEDAGGAGEEVAVFEDLEVIGPTE